METSQWRKSISWLKKWKKVKTQVRGRTWQERILVLKRGFGVRIPKSRWLSELFLVTSALRLFPRLPTMLGTWERSLVGTDQGALNNTESYIIGAQPTPSLEISSLLLVNSIILVVRWMSASTISQLNLECPYHITSHTTIARRSLSSGRSRGFDSFTYKTLRRDANPHLSTYS